jgi:two-component system, NtrC family, response regulator HydG
MERCSWTRSVMRVGSLTARKVDVRVVAATNVNLREAVAAKRFREDLYYRLGMVELTVPPLSERPEDLPFLIQYMVEKLSRQFGRSISGVSPRAKLVLAAHTWPGNVRELENVIGHACLMTHSETIDIPDLPSYLWSAGPPAPAAQVVESVRPVSMSLDEQEAQSIRKALAATNGNQSQAARLLGIGRDALRYKVKKHGLS